MRSLSVSLGLAVALAVMSIANVAVAQSQLPACQGAQTSWTNCAITITSARGRQYVGEYRAGVFTGKTSDGGITYVGGIKDNKFHGQGTATWSDGWKYVGEWRDDKFHGQGTLTFPNGEKYVGEWRDDERNGQGTLTYRDGRVQSGNWSANKFEPTEQQREQQRAQREAELQQQREQQRAQWEAEVQQQREQERREQERQEQARMEEARREKELWGRREQEFQKYAARPRTVLEQVLNYTTTGKEGGDLWDYWVSGKDGTHKCVMTGATSFFGMIAPEIFGTNHTVDLRQINPDGFRIKTGNRDGSNWSVGDEKIQIPRDQGTVMERLQKAWGLALAECPPAVRKPF